MKWHLLIRPSIAIPTVLILYSLFVVVNAGYMKREYRKAISSAKRFQLESQHVLSLAAGQGIGNGGASLSTVSSALYWQAISNNYANYAACINSHSPLIIPAWLAVGDCADLHPRSLQKP